MRALSSTAIIFLAMLPITSASGAERSDMLGKWTWQRFTIEVSECAAKGVCSKVIAGPKNVGLEIFASELVQRDGDWFGQIVNPETGATYNTRMRFTSLKTWRLDGCTTSNVCLSGEFVRAK